MSTIRAASDIGGTFTDLVYFEVDEETGQIAEIKAVKTHTTPNEFQAGVMTSLQVAGISAKDLSFFAHGSTVVINALTERKGVKTGLITTRGFRDILEIARGNRPDFFNLRYQKPAAFVPRYLRREITERVTHRGDVVTPLKLDEIEPILKGFEAEGVEAIAVCLLHSYANTNHEQQVCEEIKRLAPDVALVASHQISREWREYERTNTTALCAYVKPIAGAYLNEMERSLKRDGFTGSFYVMQSNGGIDTVSSAKEVPISIVESGPASGVLGAAALGKVLGIDDILAFDIGGTTAKCSLIDGGRVSLTNQYMIEKDARSAGYPIMTPVVDIVEIGNGGGSIGWVDEFGKMHVGPHSAGAMPGPVAYGKGGTEPTTTDANIMLGRINPNYFIGGEIQADVAAVSLAFEKLGEQLGISAIEAARGVIRIANHNMGNALKLVSINRGYDPRDFTMIAFGGGGAMHAAALARDLNIPKVIIPAHAAVFSAWGMLMSDLRRDYALTLPLALERANATQISKTFEDICAEATEAYVIESIDKADVYFEKMLELRYEGQEHTVQIPIPSSGIDGAVIEKLVQNFNDAYERKYTYRLENNVELVSCKVTAFARVDRPTIGKLDASLFGSLEAAAKEARDVDFDEYGVHQTTIYQREKLAPGSVLHGPAIVEEAASTVVVFPDQDLKVDDFGNLHINTLKDLS